MIKRYRHSIFKSYFVYLASFTMREGPRVASTQQRIKMSNMLYGWKYDAFVHNALLLYTSFRIGNVFC